MKIGFVDDYLDNWHTNHYPSYLKLASDLYGIPAKVAYAYAWRDHPDESGKSTDEWCEAQGIQRCETYEELIEKSDAVMVMCADNCLPHEELARKALMSGKPVFCDKTFAPTYEAAKRMFELAEEHGTKVFSCSAQRFCMEILCFQSQIQEHVSYSCSTGPGDMENYSIHQYEMLETLMGTGAKRCMATISEDFREIVYEYSDDRTCVFCIGDRLPFRLNVLSDQLGMQEIAVTDYYLNFMQKLLQFFDGGEIPVKNEDTLEIMAMQQAGRQALKNPGKWIEVPQAQKTRISGTDKSSDRRNRREK